MTGTTRRGNPLLGVASRLWRRHLELMTTSRLYAALVTIAAAAIAGEIGARDAKRWLADLLTRTVAGWAARQPTA